MDKSHLSPNTPAQSHRRSESASRHFGQDDGASIRSSMNPATERRIAPRKLVLCFDGTGNKFKGDDSDSNILKIFRCLDREAGDQYHYYQPGIGTYVVSNSLSHTSVRARVRSWYLKAKDSAVGSSFDQHVVGGYRFLMRFYSPGDEIYFFGFSRGAYVARFLAEMLDYVGLLSHGNEEMVAFAWKAFSRWQSRRSDNSERGKAKAKEMYRFMKGFRETFSRPVMTIRFLGLFDCVNSVPRFETAWMQRSKFPYTARSSAKVIRHCVSIDERRAKFRQDLMYQGNGKGRRHRHHHHHHHHDAHNESDEQPDQKYRVRRAGVPDAQPPTTDFFRGRQDTLVPPEDEQTFRSHSRSKSRTTGVSDDGVSDISHAESGVHPDSENDVQDIDEIWFAGGHGDVGGGWEYIQGSKSASHVPLVYMIREAEKAGLHFDPEKLREMGCVELVDDHQADQEAPERPGTADTVDTVSGTDIKINVSSPSPGTTPAAVESTDWGHFHGSYDKNDEHSHSHAFRDMLHKAHVARIHDSLEYSSGLSPAQVFCWKIMEYMPFRRMDLQPDGSWEPISWPLPCGEVRDIPNTARIHGSVIRRMNEDATYRPGNLIVGGGGRGMRRAPPEYGVGEWECVGENDDPIGEVWVRKMAPSAAS